MPNNVILRVVKDVLKDFLQEIIEVKERNIGEVLVHENINSLHTHQKERFLSCLRIQKRPRHYGDTP